MADEQEAWRERAYAAWEKREDQGLAPGSFMLGFKLGFKDRDPEVARLREALERVAAPNDYRWESAEEASIARRDIARSALTDKTREKAP